MTWWNRCFRVGGLFAAALLAGCAAAPITAEQRLTGEEGAVVFKLITNGTASADPAETLSAVILKRELTPGSKETAQDAPVLLRTRAVTNATAVFSGMVPPGRYRVIRATGYRGLADYTFPLERMLTAFEVKTGEVSLLGTLLVQPLDRWRFTVAYVPPDAELTETFEALFPALAQQTRGQRPNTFEPSAELRQRESLAPRLRELASAYNGLRAAADGTVLAGGKMGRIIWLKPGESRWRVARLGTWREVMSVGIYRQGLFAAGEEGLLRYSKDEGNTWQSLTPPDRGLIAIVEPLPNGKVIALVRREAEWTAYATDDLLTGTWRKIGSFDHERSLNAPWLGPIGVGSGTAAGIMMPNGTLRMVDGNSETIERHSTGVTTFAAQAMPDGMLVVRGGNVMATTLVSADGGKTWTDLKTPPTVQAVTFADSATTYAIAPVDPGAPLSTRFALMVSRDGAQTWTQAGEVPGGEPIAVRGLYYNRSDRSLLAFMQNGEVLRSTDQGKTWTRSL